MASLWCGFVLLLVVVVGAPLCSSQGTLYKPTWESLDARPLPAWYDNAKFGIFIHWGVFSVPSYTCGGVAAETYWNGIVYDRGNGCVREFHNKTYGPDFKYPDFAKSFRAELFDADKWANLFLKSGAKYVVLTSKHHEGFANWPSAQSWNWNSVDVGPGMDTVGLVTEAVRKVGLRMGLYHSLFEWFNPLYLRDRGNGGNTTVYVDTVLQPQLHDIVNRYHPEIIWADGQWEMDDTYWKSKEFLAWLYNGSPVKESVVVNDRWGAGDPCRHGGYYTCEDRYNPGHLQRHKWENCFTIDKRTWGFARNGDIGNYLSIDQLLLELASTVACNGNFLLNVGPTSDGVITPVYEERLLQIGTWLGFNGEAIYDTKPWRAQNDTAASVWYTAPKARNDTAYAIFFAWPRDNVVLLTQVKPRPDMRALLLGYDEGGGGGLSWKTDGSTTAIVLPNIALLSPLLQAQSAGTIKLVGVQ